MFFTGVVVYRPDHRNVVILAPDAEHGPRSHCVYRASECSFQSSHVTKVLQVFA